MDGLDALFSALGESLGFAFSDSRSGQDDVRAEIYKRQKRRNSGQLRERIEALEAENDQLQTCVFALVRILIERGQLTEQQLADQIVAMRKQTETPSSASDGDSPTPEPPRPSSSTPAKPRSVRLRPR